MAGVAGADDSSDQKPIWPENFLKGIGLSVWQNSSDKSSQWTRFAQEKNFFGQRKHAQAFQASNDFWNMYENDIRMAKELGANSFRFSFEWSRIEPEAPGKVDESAVERFHRILDCIQAHGMEPNATLHHFTHPQWFEERGGFANEENLPLWLNYVTAVFKRFGSRIRLWATFNEPAVFAFMGYVMGLWAPGQLVRMHKAGKVLCILAKAHCAAYRAIKSLPGGDRARVGLVHQHIVIVPRHNLPHVRGISKWITHFFGTPTLLHFFCTGVFEWETPFSKTKVLHREESIAEGETVLDWWGINYYSKPCVHWNCQMGPSEANEPLSDIRFRLYPQGLYDSIRDASRLGVPMYITETGVADEQDRVRAWFIRSHTSMVLKAINDGFDVRGLYYWTLMDNIEWHEGFRVKYGLYEWDPVRQRQGEQGLRLREGSKALKEVYDSWPSDMARLRKLAIADWSGAQKPSMSYEDAAALADHVAARAKQAAEEEERQQQQQGVTGGWVTVTASSGQAAGDISESGHVRSASACSDVVDGDKVQLMPK